jgi:hypothetical protein
MLGKNYDLGERFYHEHQTFVSMKSRSWIVQTVCVAIANATYAAAAASRASPPRWLATPSPHSIYMYRPS